MLDILVEYILKIMIFVLKGEFSYWKEEQGKSEELDMLDLKSTTTIPSSGSQASWVEVGEFGNSCSSLVNSDP